MTFAVHIVGRTLALDPAAIEAFASRLTGRVLVESAAEYEQARRVWNGLIDKRPAFIVRCSGVADVLDSLRFARHHNLLVAVRGGGHNVAGFGTCYGGLVIDLSASRHLRRARKAHGAGAGRGQVLPPRTVHGTTRREARSCTDGGRRRASNFSPLGSGCLRHARTNDAEFLRILEAPPGFEPGMEVLQISQGSLSC
jgi:hypothetical protein